MNLSERIARNLEEAENTLNRFRTAPENISAIGQAAERMAHSLRNGGKLISCGNGGSMCDAMHFAEELTGRFRENRRGIAAIAISDASYLSCVANDFGYEEVFSRFVESMGNEGDILLAISTSGNSANVVNGIHAAKEKGMTIIGLTGRDGGIMAGLCDIEIRAPHSRYADRAQEIHIKVIHSLIGLIEEGVL